MEIIQNVNIAKWLRYLLIDFMKLITILKSYMNKKYKGFTLIELLVVIAVIGILASVIMVTVASARNKGKDAAVMQSMREFEKLLQFEYNDNGSYANLQLPATTFFSAEDCSLGFTSSSYASEAQAICAQIVKNSSGGAFTIGSVDPTAQKYSIYTSLNTPIYLGGWPTGHDYCVGSSGIYNGTSVGNGHQDKKGCYNNP